MHPALSLTAYCCWPEVCTSYDAFDDRALKSDPVVRSCQVASSQVVTLEKLHAKIQLSLQQWCLFYRDHLKTQSHCPVGVLKLGHNQSHLFPWLSLAFPHQEVVWCVVFVHFSGCSHLSSPSLGLFWNPGNAVWSLNASRGVLMFGRVGVRPQNKYELEAFITEGPSTYAPMITHTQSRVWSNSA